MKGVDAHSLNQDAIREIRLVARDLLRKAGVIGIFPTPMQAILDAAGLRLEHAFFTETSILRKLESVPAEQIKRARGALLGLVDIRGKVIYTRPRPWITGEPHILVFHEIAHAILEWQRMLYLYAQDNEITICKESIDEFELQANAFAWELVFQGDRFHLDAERGEFSLRTPEKLARRYGTTPYATIRRFVETNRRPCALLIWSRSAVGNEFQWPPCNCVQSLSFTAHFGEVNWQTALNRFSRNELVSYHDYGPRKQINLMALNNQPIQCDASSLRLGNHLFIFVFPSSEISIIAIR